MFNNYFKVALRNLIRHKAFSIINIIGLTIGLVCFIFIMLWIQNELSYDKFHKNYDRIYTLGIDFKLGELEGRGITTTPPLAPAIMNEIPEVESAARLLGTSNKLVSNKERDINYLENEIYYADSTLFDILTISLLSGNPNDLLTRKNTGVITEKMAHKYFRNDDPVGKILTFDNDREFEITAVVKEWPANSNWHFDMLVSLVTLQHAYDTNWLSDNIHTFMLLRKDADINDVMPKINDLFEHYASPIFQQALGLPLEEWQSQGNKYIYYPTPLCDMYLRNTAQDSIGDVGDIRYVYLFAVIGFFILFVACINFMNLNTARSGVRAKEIGMRKVLGSNRQQLIQQFLLESFIISAVAMFLAIVLVEILLPLFNALTSKELFLNSAGVATIPILIVLTLVVGLMAGGYSALSLSSFRTINILKGSLFTDKSKSWLRNALVLFQFSISILVIICTIVAMNQMRFIKNKKLGFNKEHLLVVDRAYTLEDQLPLFKQELLKYPGIQSCSATYQVPGKGTSGSVYQKEDSPPEEMFHFRMISGDYDYLETMGIELVQGRYFSENIKSDSCNVLINETAAAYLGFDNPIGQKVIEPDSHREIYIIGVVKDYHLLSLHHEIPAIMLMHPGSFWDHYLSVRIQSENIAGTLGFIEKTWKDFTDNQPFEYFFMDTFFDNLHRSEQRTGKFFTIFASLAIFIACLGLFGLAAFTAEQKTKEIGVRKVLGASQVNIISILIKQFTQWVLFANIIAWPIAYFIMKSWLRNFAYHVRLNVLYFVCAGIITLLIAALTVSYLAIHAAIKNPIQSIKYE